MRRTSTSSSNKSSFLPLGVVSYQEAVPAIHWPTVGLAISSLLIIKAWPKKLARWLPGSMVALIFGTMVAWLFQANIIHLPASYAYSL